ncbi:MAG: methyltransferase domain-containing protein [Bacteroidota bacterium]
MLRYLLILLIPLAFAHCDRAETTTGPSIAAPAEDQYLKNRIAWQQPAVVIEAMGDLEEKVVADIGAGKGYFAQRLAPLCDRVIAIEIDPSLVHYLNDTLRQLELPKQIRPRLEARLGTVTDPKLTKKEVDVVLFVNTFMQIENQVNYLQQLNAAIKENGRIVIVDWKKRLMPMGPPQDLRVPLYRAEQMLQESGYTVVKSDDSSLEFQYIVVAEKVAG